MIKVIYKINDLDCHSCLEFLLKKIPSKLAKIATHCIHCSLVIFTVKDEKAFFKLTKKIHRIGFNVQIIQVFNDQDKLCSHHQDILK